jgi:hypothetical protein
MRRFPSRAATFLLASLLAAGCGGSAGAGGTARAGAESDGGTGAVGEGGDQGSPAQVVVAFYTAIRDGEFDRACKLFHPSAQARNVQAGKSCPAAVADEVGPDERAKIGDVAVDEDKIEVNGDFAKVPGKAIHNTDKPSEVDGSGQTVRTVRTDGRWWIDPGFD